MTNGIVYVLYLCMKIKAFISFLFVSVFLTGQSICIACDTPPENPPSPPVDNDCMVVEIYE